MPRLLPLLFTFALLLAPAAWAEEDAHAEDRQALLSILGDIEKALNDRNMGGVTQHLAPNAVITYQDATVTQGINEANDYYTRMMEGAGAIVKEFSTTAEVGAPAIFYGDTAVAFGRNTDTFVLARGLEFTLHGNWSTTLHKIDGQWKVIAIHFSTNLFDNPMLAAATRLKWIMFVGGLLVGIVLMWLAGRLLGRRSA